MAIQQLSFALQKKFGISARVYDFHMKNVVGSAHLGYAVDLQRFYMDNQYCCNYEPANFPGLQYRYYVDLPRHKDHHVGAGRKIALVVFALGKVVLTGAICFEQLVAVFDQSAPLFWNYRLPAAPAGAAAAAAPAATGLVRGSDEDVELLAGGGGAAGLADHAAAHELDEIE